jgi:hypothetical protein
MKSIKKFFGKVFSASNKNTMGFVLKIIFLVTAIGSVGFIAAGIMSRTDITNISLQRNNILFTDQVLYVGSTYEIRSTDQIRISFRGGKVEEFPAGEAVFSGLDISLASATIIGTFTPAVAGDYVIPFSHEDRDLELTFKVVPIPFFEVNVTGDARITHINGIHISSMNPIPVDRMFERGTMLTITHGTPPANQMFERWNIAPEGGTPYSVSEPTIELEVPNSNIRVQQMFRQIGNFGITAGPDVAIINPNADNNYPENTPVNFNITRAGNFRVTTVFIDGLSVPFVDNENGTYTISATRSGVITVDWIQMFQIEIKIDSGASRFEMHDSGTVFRLTADRFLNDNRVFSHWEVANAYFTDSLDLEVAMTTNRFVQAVYRVQNIRTFTVTYLPVVPSGGGTISHEGVEPAGLTIVSGRYSEFATFTLSSIAEPGKRLSHFIVNGSSLGSNGGVPNNTFTLEGTSAHLPINNVTITAVFIDIFTIEVDVNVVGKGSGNAENYLEILGSKNHLGSYDINTDIFFWTTGSPVFRDVSSFTVTISNSDGEDFVFDLDVSLLNVPYIFEQGMIQLFAVDGVVTVTIDVELDSDFFTVTVTPEHGLVGFDYEIDGDIYIIEGTTTLYSENATVTVFPIFPLDRAFDSWFINGIEHSVSGAGFSIDAETGAITFHGLTENVVLIARSAPVYFIVVEYDNITLPTVTRDIRGFIDLNATLPYHPSGLLARNERDVFRVWQYWTGSQFIDLPAEFNPTNLLTRVHLDRLIGFTSGDTIIFRAHYSAMRNVEVITSGANGNITISGATPVGGTTFFTELDSLVFTASGNQSTSDTTPSFRFDHWVVNGTVVTGHTSNVYNINYIRARPTSQPWTVQAVYVQQWALSVDTAVSITEPVVAGNVDNGTNVTVTFNEGLFNSAVFTFVGIAIATNGGDPVMVTTNKTWAFAMNANIHVSIVFIEHLVVETEIIAVGDTTTILTESDISYTAKNAGGQDVDKVDDVYPIGTIITVTVELPDLVGREFRLRSFMVNGEDRISEVALVSGKFVFTQTLTTRGLDIKAHVVEVFTITVRNAETEENYGVFKRDSDSTELVSVTATHYFEDDHLVFRQWHVSTDGGLTFATFGVEGIRELNLTSFAGSRVFEARYGEEGHRDVHIVDRFVIGGGASIDVARETIKIYYEIAHINLRPIHFDPRTEDYGDNFRVNTVPGPAIEDGDYLRVVTGFFAEGDFYSIDSTTIAILIWRNNIIINIVNRAEHFVDVTVLANDGTPNTVSQGFATFGGEDFGFGDEFEENGDFFRVSQDNPAIGSRNATFTAPIFISGGAGNRGYVFTHWLIDGVMYEGINNNVVIKTLRAISTNADATVTAQAFYRLEDFFEFNFFGQNGVSVTAHTYNPTVNEAFRGSNLRIVEGGTAKFSEFARVTVTMNLQDRFRFFGWYLNGETEEYEGTALAITRNISDIWVADDVFVISLRAHIEQEADMIAYSYLVPAATPTSAGVRIGTIGTGDGLVGIDVFNLATTATTSHEGDLKIFVEWQRRVHVGGNVWAWQTIMVDIGEEGAPNIVPARGLDFLSIQVGIPSQTTTVEYRAVYRNVEFFELDFGSTPENVVERITVNASIDGKHTPHFAAVDAWRWVDEVGGARKFSEFSVVFLSNNIGLLGDLSIWTEYDINGTIVEERVHQFTVESLALSTGGTISVIVDAELSRVMLQYFVNEIHEEELDEVIEKNQTGTTPVSFPLRKVIDSENLVFDRLEIFDDGDWVSVGTFNASTNIISYLIEAGLKGEVHIRVFYREEILYSIDGNLARFNVDGDDVDGKFADDTVITLSPNIGIAGIFEKWEIKVDGDWVELSNAAVFSFRPIDIKFDSELSTAVATDTIEIRIIFEERSLVEFFRVVDGLSPVWFTGENVLTGTTITQGDNNPPPVITTQSWFVSINGAPLVSVSEFDWIETGAYGVRFDTAHDHIVFRVVYTTT